ncbi:MAG: hypothetical protein HYZ20_03070 [Burkholderiales bacterium]|nr:hypothetical protein [Burkholderiales bacterium]
MPTLAAKPRSANGRASAAEAQAFWSSLQRFASAADRVVGAPRAVLVEGGIKSRKEDSGAEQLATELGDLASKLEEIRARLATGDRRLVSQVERDRAGKFLSRLVSDGVLVEPAGFAEALHITRQALSKALSAQRVFYVEVGGQRYYPSFFADPRYERRQLESVSKALGELPGASKLQFFLTKKASLEGLTPLDALAQGRYSRVRTAAQGFAER